jgi:hypothetical protein
MLIIDSGVENGMCKRTQAVRGDQMPSKGHNRAPEEEVLAYCDEQGWLASI